MFHWKSLATYLVLILMLLGLFITNPVLLTAKGKPLQNSADKLNLLRHTQYLSTLTPTRSVFNKASITMAKDYISNQMISYGYEISTQDINSGKNTTLNLFAEYPGESQTDIVVLGAHYDSFGDNNPGADDNASGVAGLLEIARLLKENKPDLPFSIHLAFYTNEEPPFFATKDMGSLVHAQKIKTDKKLNVLVMISLEMIGYYSENWFSQTFPLKILNLYYPTKGNFIGLIGNMDSFSLIRKFKRKFIPYSKLRVYSLNGPQSIKGVDLSDHRSFWAMDFPALMVTDTAFFRNFEYHKPGDIYERLDYRRMAEVVNGTYGTITTWHE